MEYKQTLNMPKSGFPMRAGLPNREPGMLQHWQELDLYNEMLKKNEGKPPPYRDPSIRPLRNFKSICAGGNKKASVSGKRQRLNLCGTTLFALRPLKLRDNGRTRPGLL